MYVQVPAAWVRVHRESDDRRYDVDERRRRLVSRVQSVQGIDLDPRGLAHASAGRPRGSAAEGVWVPTLGEVRSVYRCPDCEGAFLEIRAMAELTACPKCGDDQFAIDPTADRVIAD